MRDSLPKSGPWTREAVIVNLDSNAGQGTHWVCFKKTGKHVDYFDAYGDLKPPIEVERYLCGNYVSYNRGAYQSVERESDICGHLSLAFLCLQ